MPIRTISLYTYRTRGGPWSDAHLGVLRFKQALKGETVGSQASIRVFGQMYPIGASNAGDACVHFGNMARVVIIQELRTTAVVLVPIPDSDSTMRVARCRTATLAEAIAARSDAIVADVLRWSVSGASSRRGGIRDPALLHERLRRFGRLPSTTRPYVLIDDFTTSGAHIQACAAFLKSLGGVVKLAVCGGKTDQNPPEDVFRKRVDVYDDLE